MPYIAPGERDHFVPVARPAETAGQLNFQITHIALEYLKTRGRSYATINEVVGALECAKLEFYRRAAAPYEDIKININGDIYP